MDDVTLNPPAPTTAPTGDPSAAQTTQTSTSEATNTSSTRFLDALPEAYRTSETFTKFVDPTTKDLSLEKLAQSYEHLQSAAGWPADQILRMPKAEDAEGWSALYGRLGRPETAEAYAFNGFEAQNEGDKAFVEGFRTEAHAAGFSQKQMDVMMGYLGKSLSTVDKQIEDQVTAQRDAATTALKTVWGDKYDVMRTEIPQSVEWLGQQAGLIDKTASAEVQAQQRDDLVKALNVGGEADNPQLMRLFGALADLRAEGSSLPGNGRAVEAGAMTFAQAQAAKTAFLADPVMTTALHDATDPKHAIALARRDELNKIISEQSQAAS